MKTRLNSNGGIQPRCLGRRSVLDQFRVFYRPVSVGYRLDVEAFFGSWDTASSHIIVVLALHAAFGSCYIRDPIGQEPAHIRIAGLTAESNLATKVSVVPSSIPYLYVGQRDRQAHRAHPFRIEA